MTTKLSVPPATTAETPEIEANLINNDYSREDLLDVFAACGDDRAYCGCYTDRGRRFEVRELRRRGNWSFINLPTAFLWVENNPTTVFEYEY